MADDRARRTHAVFVRALDVDGAQRDAFLADACAGDAMLEARVRRLLAALPQSSDFLEQPALATRLTSLAGAVGAPETRRAASAPPALSIRGYRLLRVIGAGGMATVYAAEQEQPRRTVALKVMNAALASTSALRRFAYETEVLARLKHPGIAQIYEAGTCDDGAGRPLPFFAMELVSAARTIIEHAEERRLSLEQRLALFAEVCDAVQHGHQQGVIHRDLKPANVLVDADGRARIIDFGIARPADATQAASTLHADAGQIIGTLSTMSPEQCTGGAIVDVRTDIYALGVILYQLVSGRLPHDLRNLPLPAAIQIIVSAAPTPLGQLVPRARGDLQAIVSTAMEKQPERRYASAAALAADVRRYLRHEPIDARPPTLAERAIKFARRNPSLAVAIGSAAVMLLAAVAVTTGLAYVAEQARRAEGAARQAAEARERELEQVIAFQETQLSDIDVRALGARLRQALLDGATAAIAAAGRDRAVVERDTAELLRLLRGVNFTTLALGALDESLLQRSHAALRRQFAGQPLVQARLLQRLAGTMSALGLPEQAERALAEALQIRRERLGAEHPDTLQSAHALGTVLSALGRYDAAVQCLRDVHARCTERLGADDPLTLRAATSLGGALRRRGELDEAEQLWRDTLERQRRVLGDDDPETLRSLNNMGIMHAVRGRLEAAEACWRELIQRRERLLAPGHPDLRVAVANLAMVLQDQGRLQEAHPLLESDLAFSRERFGDDHEDTLSAINNLASLLVDMESLPAAERLQRECLHRRLRALGPEHADTLRSAIALGATLNLMGQAWEAEALLRPALAGLRRTLGEDHEDVLIAMVNAAPALQATDQLEAAFDLACEALERAGRTLPPGHAVIIEGCIALGRVLTVQGRLDEAETAFRDAIEAATTHRGADHPLTRRARRALNEFIEYDRSAGADAGSDKQ